ncbi:MAG: hypothetical protein MZV63_60590 [Marinilabiliales bacterium]|nr:hypothetical protein [Marinilabiliales bacterium]
MTGFQAPHGSTPAEWQAWNGGTTGESRYLYEISAVGDQYDFNRKSPWLDDDNPGWGASWEDLKGTVIAGNTFDYSAVHGSSILIAGWSFFSVSDEYFTSAKLDASSYRLI